MDTNRELRSMIFCVIHLPPLPAVVSRLDRDDNAVIDDEATESSHSIIGSMMEWAAMANNDKANAKRLLAQKEMFAKFNEELLTMDLDACSSEALFEFYCKHTRQWLNTYSTVGNLLRFKPLDFIAGKDKTHVNMMGYAKAQCRLHTGQPCKTGELENPYADLMRLCAHWTRQSLLLELSQEGDNSTDLDDTPIVFTGDQCEPTSNGSGVWVTNAEKNGVDLVASQ